MADASRPTNKLKATDQPDVEDPQPSANSSTRRRSKLKSAKDKSFADNLGEEMLELFVGAERKKLLVHKNIICDAIEYFDRMFRRGFQEAQEGSAEFPEDDPEPFGLLIEWCYRKDGLPVFRPPTSGPDIFNRVRVFCLAEKYCVTRLMDESMDFILASIRSYQTVMGLGVCQYAYDHSSEGSALRLFTRRHFSYTFFNKKHEAQWPTDKVSETLTGCPALLHDVLACMRASTSFPKHMECNPLKEKRCHFHVHTVRNNVDQCPYGMDSDEEYRTPNASRIYAYLSIYARSTACTFNLLEICRALDLPTPRGLQAMRELSKLGLLEMGEGKWEYIYKPMATTTSSGSDSELLLIDTPP